MSSNYRKQQRRLEIERLREEGAAAYRAGRSRQACPREYMKTMDRMHWVGGYDAAEAEGQIADLVEELDCE